jgi:hypothetical protein
MWFELLSPITELETIAVGTAIREVDRLRNAMARVAGANAKALGKSASSMIR